MKAIVEYEPPDHIIVIQAENLIEARILARFLDSSTKVFALSRNQQYSYYPNLVIRKEPDKCRTKQKVTA